MKLTVPTSFKDIVVRQLVEIESIKGMDRHRKRVHTTSILCNVPYEKSISLPISVHLEIDNETNFIYSEPKIEKIKDVYKIGSLYYKPILDVTKCSAGQYIDAKAIVSSGEVVSNIHKLIACFLIPVGAKYSTDVYEDTCKNVYNYMNVEDAYSLQVFFCDYFQILTQDIQTSLVKQEMEQVFKTIHLKGIGVGL